MTQLPMSIQHQEEAVAAYEGVYNTPAILIGLLYRCVTIGGVRLYPMTRERALWVKVYIYNNFSVVMKTISVILMCHK